MCCGWSAHGKTSWAALSTLTQALQIRFIAKFRQATGPPQGPKKERKKKKKKKKKKESPLGHHRSFFPSSSFAFLVLLVAFLPLRFFRSHTPHTQRTQRSQPTTKGKGTASKWQAASGKVHVPRCQLVGKAQQQQRSSTVCCIRACTQNRFEKKKQVCSAALPCRSLLLDSSVLCALCLVLCCMV